jgi:O-antigen/teichoic acid export membrane protein
MTAVSDPQRDGVRDRMVRNTAVIAGQRAGLLLVGVLYALLVPRILGPEDYGRFSLLISLSTLFFVLSDLGLPQALSRQVPELLPGSTRASRTAWLGVLVRTRAAAGAVAALIFLGWTRLFFPDLPPAAAPLLGLAIVVGGVTDALVSWLLGRNEADRWGWSFLLRRAQYLVLLPAGYHLGGLPGACTGVLLAEFAVLVYAVRQHEEPPDLRAPAATVPRRFWLFALSFLAGNALAGAYRYSGEMLVKWAGCDYHEVGFFGAALNVFAAAEAGFVQLLAATAPFLSGRLVAGRPDEAARWLERILFLLLSLAGCGVIAAAGLADQLVPLVFGAGFTPVAAALPLTALALTAAVLGHGAVSAALAARRPRVYIGSAALRMLLFWLIGLPAARQYGAGGAWAAAVCAQAVGAALATVAARRVVAYRVRYLLVPLALLVPAAALAAGGGLARTLPALAGYAGLLLASGLVRRDEWSALGRALRGRMERRP